ncbi:MAG: bL21 family ribosomal protein [Candidatus Moeniiplasma glomeromycotorum]|nr:bL21 family ribosomal protein [Candidatus Moeniiplasma glomeromycotorum]MCE8162506.1 bL21 family ribosomal protein [Candidatus Moeniiplasma glomeromycotorum]MCE8166433.1 bL21 family ribosomal protein [Candidatus Moeniiplasma glomeromycotorum]MCE8166918.1 bL21 family ribosomal protein [Candidatus Moeniiplasma glomeromycotorum]
MSTIFEKGKQIRYFANKLAWIDYQKDAEPGDIIKVDRVLKHGGEFGQPYLKGIIVNLEVIDEKSLGKKIIIGKKKAKKRYQLKKGFRASFTVVKMVGVEDQRQSAK